MNLSKIQIPATSAITAQIEIIIEEGYYKNQADWAKHETITLSELLSEYKRLSKLETYYKMAMNSLEGTLTQIRKVGEETISKFREGNK